MEVKRQHPLLWQSEKYLRWPPYFASPVIRMPLPGGSKRSYSVQRADGEAELEFFERCVKERNALGEAQWGKTTWAYMLSVKSRSVTRGESGEREKGVRHVVTAGKSNAWQATWYERDAQGKRRQRSQQFSYGTPNARYETSEQAKARAEAVRKKKERDWYIADSQLFHQRRISYREMFQRDIGAAITEKLKALSREEVKRKRKELPVLDDFMSSKKPRFTPRPMAVDDLLDIADCLGIVLEVNVLNGLASARGVGRGD